MMQDVRVKLNLDCHGKSSCQHEGSVHQQTERKFKEEASEMLHLDHSFV
jgi:hypothetical protein